MVGINYPTGIFKVSTINVNLHKLVWGWEKEKTWISSLNPQNNEEYVCLDVENTGILYACRIIQPSELNDFNFIFGAVSFNKDYNESQIQGFEKYSKIKFNNAPYDLANSLEKSLGANLL